MIVDNGQGGLSVSQHQRLSVQDQGDHQHVSCSFSVINSLERDGRH